MVMGMNAARDGTLEIMADGATQINVWHLGWHFDKLKGAYRIKSQVMQPAPVTCKPVAEQRRQGFSMHSWPSIRHNRMNGGWRPHNAAWGNTHHSLLLHPNDNKPAEGGGMGGAANVGEGAGAGACGCGTDPVHAVSERELVDLLEFTDNLRGVKTFVELGSSSEFGARLWSVLDEKIKSSGGGGGGGSARMPHFYSFETVERHCTKLRCWKGCEGTANNGNVHITCAQSPFLLDIRGNLRGAHHDSPDRRDAFTRHYTATYAGGLQQVMGTEQGKSGLDFVVLSGRFRVAMAMRAYVMLSPTGYVVLDNCERDAYGEVFTFFDKVRELGGGLNGGGGGETRCLMRPKRFARAGSESAKDAPTVEAAEKVYRVYMATDGGGYSIGS